MFNIKMLKKRGQFVLEKNTTKLEEFLLEGRKEETKKIKKTMWRNFLRNEAWLP